MTTVLNTYTVISSSGIYLGTKHYAVGSIVFLTDAASKYLLANRQIAHTGDYVKPEVPTPVIPGIEETNTVIDIKVSGVDHDVTIANFIDLFPRLQGQKGDKGDTGERGPQGIQGNPGPPGSSSDSAVDGGFF